MCIYEHVNGREWTANKDPSHGQYGKIISEKCVCKGMCHTTEIYNIAMRYEYVLKPTKREVFKRMAKTDSLTSKLFLWF